MVLTAGEAYYVAFSLCETFAECTLPLIPERPLKEGYTLEDFVQCFYDGASINIARMETFNCISDPQRNTLLARIPHDMELWAVVLSKPPVW